MTRVAVVTLARGRHDHLAAQHESLARGGRLPDDHLVVAMDDPGIGASDANGLRRRVVRVPLGPDGRLPLASARNAGVAEALARGADVVVGLDVDCLAGAGLVAAYAEAVAARPDVLWSGPVTYLPPAGPGGYDLTALDRLDDPHPARPAPAPGEARLDADHDLFWSLSFAVSRDGWERSGGFCEDYTGYGGEDTDFARGCRAAGIGHGWVGSARAYHQHHPVDDPPTRHLDDILRNGALFADRWGEWPMQGWLEEFERRGLVQRCGGGWVRRLTRPAAGYGSEMAGTGRPSTTRRS